MGRMTDDRQPADEPATTPGSARGSREREAHRMAAADLFDAGVRQADVARRLGVSHQAVSRWHARWESGGRKALLAGVAGRRPRLSPEQLRALARALRKDPQSCGVDAPAWTVRSAGVLIEQVTGVRYHRSHVWRILRQHLGWAPTAGGERPAPGTAARTERRR